ncbi:winged helix-turn-helix domain-containing protein [Acidiphilium sp. PA]|uniref:ArsR/SmtB family transcription factor n=1 Tax=Acidiphilium sp. PA TaxID=2871705 RepID=UPI0022449211|nr:winged helix-turn-helix domain-containing protein [Acidiphilium sp. PA]MCW8306869.1 winged helix-turn-helix domain-containing protein [Acidiphilium sp. PA]
METSNQPDPHWMVTALAALAHEHRLAAYRLLVEAGPPGVAAGEIAARLGLVPSSLTFHIQALLRAGLVTQRRASRHVIYAADFAAMNGFIGFLMQNCCGQGVVACAPCAPVQTDFNQAQTA